VGGLVGSISTRNLNSRTGLRSKKWEISSYQEFGRGAGLTEVEMERKPKDKGRNGIWDPLNWKVMTSN